MIQSILFLHFGNFTYEKVAFYQFSHVFYIFQFHQMLHKDSKSVILILTIVRFNRNPVLKIRTVTFHLIINDNNIFETAPTSKNLQILNEYFVLFNKEALFSGKDMVKERFPIESLNHNVCILRSRSCEKYQFEVVRKFYQCVQQTWSQFHIDL